VLGKPEQTRRPGRETAPWNASTFRGAILLLGEVIGTADQRRTALGFFRQRRDLLVRMG
jgi:hypothetical protein